MLAALRDVLLIFGELVPMMVGMLRHVRVVFRSRMAETLTCNAALSGPTIPGLDGIKSEKVRVVARCFTRRGHDLESLGPIRFRVTILKGVTRELLGPTISRFLVLFGTSAGPFL